MIYRTISDFVHVCITRYLAALEFAALTMALGFGWVYPSTAAERLYTLVCMMAGGTLYAYVIGTVWYVP